MLRGTLDVVQQGLLIIHLAGAAVAAALVVASIVAVLMRKASIYRPLAFGLVGIGAAQIASGAALAYVAGGTLLMFCVRIVAYLVVLSAVELMLLIAARRARIGAAARVPAP